MQRCVSPALRRTLLRAAGSAFAALVAATALPAGAQAPRNFPAPALRGELVVTAPPEVRVNGQPARLAPGARLRGPDNLLVMSGAIVGRKLLVHYTRDTYGNLLDVWVLTPAEAALKPWPATPAEAAAWQFNASEQTWSKP